jgi:hypothetical protein
MKCARAGATIQGNPGGGVVRSVESGYRRHCHDQGHSSRQVPFYRRKPRQRRRPCEPAQPVKRGDAPLSLRSLRSLLLQRPEAGRQIRSSKAEINPTSQMLKEPKRLCARASPKEQPDTCAAIRVHWRAFAVADPRVPERIQCQWGGVIWPPHSGGSQLVDASVALRGHRLPVAPDFFLAPPDLPVRSEPTAEARGLLSIDPRSERQRCIAQLQLAGLDERLHGL